MLELRVQQIYFDAIADGRKTIEGRLAKEKFRMLQTGDRIKFFNNEGTQSVVKTVVATRVYRTFEQSFRNEDYKNAIPGAKNASFAVSVYERFYSEEMQNEHGVIFIEIR